MYIYIYIYAFIYIYIYTCIYDIYIYIYMAPRRTASRGCRTSASTCPWSSRARSSGPTIRTSASRPCGDAQKQSSEGCDWRRHAWGRHLFVFGLILLIPA